MSTVDTKDTEVWEDGKEYPLVKLEISNMSHPFFTGKMKFVDTAGRIDKFNKKFAKFAKDHPTSQDDAKEATEEQTEEKA
jgi:large subunit ribosomal protein L31